MSREIITIQSLDDERISVYRNLKDRDIARQSDRFIAESELVVRRLLESDFPIESVFLAQRRVDEISPLVKSAPVYVVPDVLMSQVIGYKFHSGVIACGRRKPRENLEAIMSRTGPKATLVICPEIANTENLGGLIRIAAGFGVDAMILGEHSCDPFYRQSIRVSMGTVFRLRLHRSENLLDDLRKLKSEWKFELIATVLDETAEDLATSRRADRIGLLFGNEAQGLSPRIVAACDRKMTIPMKLGTDSLNVAVAAGVFLYHFTR